MAIQISSSKLNKIGNCLIRLLCVNDVYNFRSSSAGNGGFPVLSTLLKQNRANFENCIFSVNGDFLGGSTLNERFKGKMAIDLFNALHVDAVVIGNRKFETNLHFFNFFSRRIRSWVSRIKAENA